MWKIMLSYQNLFDLLQIRDHQAKLRGGVDDGDSHLVLHPCLHVGHCEAIVRQENLIVFHSVDWSWLLWPRHCRGLARSWDERN